MENVKNIQTTNVWLNSQDLFKTKTNTEFFITKKIKEAIKEMRAYSFYRLRSSWLTQSHRTCPRCNAAIKKEKPGKNKCVSYFCYNCQLLFRK
jgi:hypothetical protein